MGAPELPPGAKALTARAETALPGAPAWVGIAPGRINVIGEHTDYIEGLSLPTGVDRWAVVRVRPRTDGRVILRALDLNESFQWRWGDRPSPSAGWARTMAGAVSVCAEVFSLPECGFDAVITGDVPRGGGISSSAALCVAWVNALAAWGGDVVSPMARARLAQRVEHEWSGVPCGLLDQVASQISQADRLLRVDFRDLTVSTVPADTAGHGWLVLDTGVRRELAASAYAERVQQVREGLQRVSAGTDVQHWRELTLEHLSAGDVLDARLRHGITENARVDKVIEQLERGDLAGVGRTLMESHTSLRDDYAVSCAELDVMVDAAGEDSGCLGARMMGGGFGGCALALVSMERAEAVASHVLERYAQRFPHPATATLVRGVDGARGWRVE